MFVGKSVKQWKENVMVWTDVRDEELFAPDFSTLKSSHQLKSVRCKKKKKIPLTPLCPDRDDHHRHDCSSQLHPPNNFHI